MKPRLIRLYVAALVAVGFATFSPRASADTVDTLSLSLNPSLPSNGNGVNGGGAFTWTQSPINSNFSTDLTTYCIQLGVAVRDGTFTTHTDLTQAPNITTGNLGAITTLYDHFYSSSFTGANPAVSEAAFQYALWKLVYGSSYTIPTGTTTNQIEAAKEANYLLAGKMYNGAVYNNVEHDLANAYLVALVPNDTSGGTKPNQAQILVQPKGVPAPPAAMLAGIGVLALLGRARWNRRKAAPAA